MTPTKLIGLTGLMGLCTLALAACTTGAGDAPEVLRGAGPPDARPDACYGRDESPARVETVTEQVLVRPAVRDGSGAVIDPAGYRTETSQRIVQERRELWFETPCHDQLTGEDIASLQRALRARGVYSGPINGQMDAATRAAVRAFQSPMGIESGILSIAAARRLGLVAWLPGPR